MLRFTPLTCALVAFALFAPAVNAKVSPNVQAKAALERVLPEIKFTNVAIRDCLDFLRDISGANIHVNWKALEGAGVTQETLVNMRLRSVTLGKVLTLLLSESGAQSGLTYYLDEGVLEVTTKDLSDKIMITKVYNVEDLLVEVSDFENATDFSLASNNSSGTSSSSSGSTGASGRRSSSSGTGSGSTGMTGSRSGTGSGSTSGTGATAGKTKADRGNALVQLITETIQPEIWRPAGTAAIKFWQGSLIVTAPRSVHEQLGGPID